MSLYRLNPREIHYVIDKDGKGLGICQTAGDIHLYPKSNGDYSVPATSKLRREELGQAMIEEFGKMRLKIRLLILFVAVAGLFRPGIVYASVLKGIVQKIREFTSSQEGAEVMSWLMQELSKDSEAGK